jgi:hypothetical protein
VKVIGGFEIYNFRIQRLVHFYTRFWRYLISNRGPAKRFGPGHRRAATSRVPARRPRPPAGRGSLFPMRRAPRPLESSRSHARHGLRRTGSVRAADLRSVGGAPPYVRRSRPGTTTASPWSRCRHPGRAAPINVACSPLLTLTLPPHRTIHAAAFELRPPASHDRATAHAPPLDPIGPSRATCCPGRALTVAGAEPPWPPPPVLAVRPHRRIPHLNSGYPQALGEHVVTPTVSPARSVAGLPESGRRRRHSMHGAKLQGPWSFQGVLYELGVWL